MKKSALVPSIGLSLISIGTAGCASYNTSVRAYGECSAKTGGGGECKAGAEIKWEKKGGGGGGGGGKESIMLAALAAALDSTADAAQFQIDTTGSTIPYPANGMVNVLLVRSSDNSVVATHTFPYVKSGAVIRLADPDSVNSWAYSNAGDADSVRYETVPFTSMFQGEKKMAVATKYEGQSVASFTATVYGNPPCTRYPSPTQCPPQ
ncbi:hypothetical protein NG829_18900 [Xanthomonas sacchari]|uniref:hypothetical protein n=1 Tax=Xanthomonas TaxID=338 RepID=UPI0012E05159|nr:MULTISPECIES: hypothetical protein [Xanthomonas]MDY4341030.1 hypothetical protein [Xanthomonas sp. LF07-6]UYK80381.1 hypothetical protein NG829_18900 [Xanthomonas sacchari]